MLAVMIVAGAQLWKNGFFAMDNGVELPLLYGTAGVALSFVDPGRFSLDAALGLTPGPSLKLIGIAIGVAPVGAMAALVVRHAAPAG
jgi:putative oxidoreductase